MFAVLRGSIIVEFVTYEGPNANYPVWFEEELYWTTYTDEYRFTYWVHPSQRKPDYYEKKLVEDFSVFLRKPDGDVFCTDWDTFYDLYLPFDANPWANCGKAAFKDDCIEYYEYRGILDLEYAPKWFYEYYTEALNLPEDNELIIFDKEGQDTSLWEHSIFLRNRFGEIKKMSYRDFLKHYKPIF